MLDAEIADIVGIGIGPANLSMAALLYPVKDVTYRFLEKRVRDRKSVV